jgi:hypothetical protein
MTTNGSTPPPQSAPRKAWIRRHPIWTTVIVLFIIGAIGSAFSGGSKPGHAAATSSASSGGYTPPTPPAGPTPAAAPATPAAAPAPNPEGTTDTSCDEDLGGSSIYDPVYLTGEADVTNTGNIGITVRVRMAWHQEAYPDVTAPAKTVRVKPGHTRPVRFRFYVGTYAGSTEALDRSMSWQDSHDGQPCHSRARITGTFGDPQ